MTTAESSINFLMNREALTEHGPRLGERTQKQSGQERKVSVMKKTKANSRNQTPVLDDTGEETIPASGFRGEESLPPGGFRGEESLPAGGFRGEEQLPPGGFRGEESLPAGGFRYAEELPPGG